MLALIITVEMTGSYTFHPCTIYTDNNSDSPNEALSSSTTRKTIAALEDACRSMMTCQVLQIAKEEYKLNAV